MYLKRGLLLFSVILFFSCTSKETKDLKVEKKPVENALDFDNKMTTVKENFKQINQIKKWTAIDSLELNETTEGGVAKFYYSKKKLQKIVLKLYGETGMVFYECYLKDEKPSFVFEKEIRYNRPIYWDVETMKEFEDTETFDESKSKLTEKRYYFFNGELFEKRIVENKNKEVVLQQDLNKEQDKILKIFRNLKLKTFQ